jgi:hypothetical protein
MDNEIPSKISSGPKDLEMFSAVIKDMSESIPFSIS